MVQKKSCPKNCLTEKEKEMINIDRLGEKQFKELPLVVEGESKEIRYAGNAKVVIRLKPTIYSFTEMRADIVKGSDKLRLEATKIFLKVLRENGIKHAYQEINKRWILSDLLLQARSKHNPDPFRPDDLSAEEMDSLAVAQPIETIIKQKHTGSSKHKYYQMDGHPIRKSHPLFDGMLFDKDGDYPQTIVRFDWRNPFEPMSHNGVIMQDEVLGEMQADWFIDTTKARQTALKVADAISYYLNRCDILFYDLCLFIAEDGKTVYGEISQDCGRYRHFDFGSLDKDIWRQGGSGVKKEVMKKWKIFNNLINNPKKEE